MAQILVVDDEIGIRELLSEILRDEGHDVRLAENAAAARAARDAARPDLVLLDIWMPDSDGVTLLKEWAANGQLSMPVVMMSGHATIDTAVEATRIGALDFLEKPIALARLLAAVKRALEKSSPAAAVSVSLSLAAFNRSGPLRDLKRQLEQVTAKSRSLLLRSKPGGIVELMARTLQVAGKGWLDLAHDPNPLTLDTLQGTFGGVLYVEELARLTRMQQKNLQFALERLEKFALHLVVATEHNLDALRGQGWDEALLRRLSDVALGAPALAELRDEIPDLAAHLLMQLAESGEAPLRRLSTAAQNALRQHSWPGGYGELRSTLRSLALAALEEAIAADDVAHLLNPPTGSDALAKGKLAAQLLELPLREAREIFERSYFEFHLRDANGNMSRVAEKCGMERTHLYRKLKDLGLR
jgi:DNA-binding NtrC family response regulator